MLRNISIFISLILCTLTSCVKPEPDNGPEATHDELSHLSIYQKDGNDVGVIYYVDPNDNRKGKAVSIASGLMQWATSNESWRINSYKENYDYVHTVITSSEKYIETSDNFPAVKFCDDMRRNYGGNWHVPSLSEINMLFNAYYGKSVQSEVSSTLEYNDLSSKDAALRFDSILESVGGDSMLKKNNKYWICAQNSNGNMQYVNMQKYSNGNDLQTIEKYVRCVLDIDNTVSEDKVDYPQTNIGKLIEGPLTSRVVDIY